MDAIETTLVLIIALALIVLAVFFAWRQRLTMRSVHDDITLSRDQRRYWYKQTTRRLLGSIVMVLIAAALVGSLFLDYEPMKAAGANAPFLVPEEIKQAARFPIVYWVLILLMVMAILALAVFDLWATARFGIQQQRQLAQEHQHALEAELARLRRRQSELN